MVAQLQQQMAAVLQQQQEPRALLACYQEGEDVEAFLTTFERTMVLRRIDEEDWPSRLIPLLTGRARAAYHEVEADVAYPRLREALLEKFEITSIASRVRLRQMKFQMKDDIGAHLTRMEVLARRWLLPLDDPTETDQERIGRIERQVIREVVMEHIRHEMPPELQRCMDARNPNTVDEVRQYVREYQLQHPARDESQRRVQHPPRSGARQGAERTTTTPAKRGEKQDVRCYRCQQRGHCKWECPNPEKTLRISEERHQDLLDKGEVNGRPVERIQIDTGASRTVVNSDVVPEVEMTGEKVSVTLADGAKRCYPTADVEIKFDGEIYRVRAAIVKGLVEDVLLGRDVPRYRHTPGRLSLDELRILREKSDQGEEELNSTATVLQVTTRAQARAQGQQSAERGNRAESEPSDGKEVTGPGCGDDELNSPEELDLPPTEPTESGAVGVESEDPEADNEEEIPFAFEDELFAEPGKERCKTTRAGRRAQNRAYLTPTGVPKVTQLKSDQERDPDVQKWRATEIPEGVVQKEGIYYRRWHPRNAPGETYEQLVLPKTYRSKVLKLAHSMPMAGHLGRDKATQRIQRRFYWPTMYRDVKRYCQECPECQRFGGAGRKAPLIPLPIIGEPFRRIAMDVVGPLPRTSRGNRFILVVSDYATRYPEAIALRRVTAEKVAEELVTLFSRHGIPEEILTDQGTNFTSTLLGELYRMIGVKAIRTSPYHPQTDGLVERFNQTLKKMLKKVLAGEGRQWDVMLPYVLFAHREAPQATVGFTPFELLLGLEVRGLLDVLREDWTGEKDTEEDVVTYVSRVRERMEEAQEIVKQNSSAMQTKHKEYYDRKARELNLDVGDQVLLLLPDSNKKFLAKWQGPYKITRKIGRVNYEIKMPDKGDRKQIFHVNLLKRWKTRPEEEPEGIYHIEEEDLQDCDWRGEETGVQMGRELTPIQAQELDLCLQRYPEVTSSKPGLTTTTEHKVPTGETPPIRQRPYRIPHAYKDEVLKELQAMKDARIIEPSDSEWSAPMVIVRKKDSTIRICIDYRKLNQHTKFDAYPMPRIDELLDAIGKAEFITKLDLAKGFWQVPMTEEDKPKTAFASPIGLYQFTVCHSG